MPDVGEPAPDFTLSTTRGDVSLRKLHEGKKVVIAFYIDDHGPICELELSSFKEEYARIQELGADVIAIGGDSLESHHRFDESLGGCPFPLASDHGLEVAWLYDAVWADGGQGIRAVYVVDESGTIIHKDPWYQPGNVGQFMGIIQALGLD